ncbi:mediator of RNA polymerase II transcription complex subunit 8-domain-containing protein [Apiosordaria backusii]|uniref:Mediator of RNA polymerase II transcription subunit 8 n=1 Tax=Apiosordaria backusii TaxID=314023 RepID=A0AA40EYS6_9PEZI|nr:mediator of RNA polymerase II transcription complex subunit 8-domain-containing protein [Apiosordaria backusii]
MASLNLQPEDLKHLDLLRNRCATLSLNLSNAHRNMALTYPLPSRESLQASAAIIQTSLRSLQSILSENTELFQRIAVHPSTNFPGRTQLDFLSSMLRKKPEPEIETKMELALEKARQSGIDASTLVSKRRGGGRDMDDDDDEDNDYGEGDDAGDEPTNEQWADCLYIFEGSLRDYIQVQEQKSYTVEEQEMGVENVRTGLRRNLLEEESESEDEEDEEEEEEEGDGDEDLVMMDGSMEGRPGGGRGVGGGLQQQQAQQQQQGRGKAGVQPEHLFWLYARGRTDLPQRIELESSRVVKGQVKRLPPR